MKRNLLIIGLLTSALTLFAQPARNNADQRPADVQRVDQQHKSCCAEGHDCKKEAELSFDNPATDPPQFGMRWVYDRSFHKKRFHVYDCTDEGKVYKADADPRNCFFVISKREFRIYVYERVDGDISLVAHFPVCVARNPGDKQRSGDGTTPVCAKRNGEYVPFTISQIQPASSWRHNFGDGRGNILAYGDWFMRLRLNSHPRVSGNTSIGIHGSSGNAASVPGRDSEGCIRLRNADLNTLRQFARVGTQVIIKPENAGKLPYELKAQEKLGVKYFAPRRGYTLLPNTVFAD